MGNIRKTLISAGPWLLVIIFSEMLVLGLTAVYVKDHTLLILEFAGYTLGELILIKGTNESTTDKKG